MKIAIISSGFLPVIDGITCSLYNRLQKLSEYGHEVLLLCPDYSDLKTIYPNYQDYIGYISPKVRVVSLDSEAFMGFDFERNVSHKSYKILLEELEKFKPDIIHVDEPERLFLGLFRIPGLHFAKQNNIPCVSFFHTNFLEYGKDYFPLPQPIENIVQFLFKIFLRWLYNFYDITLVSGDNTYNRLLDIGIKKLCKSDLLGVDTTKFSPQLREDKFFEHKYKLKNIDNKIKLIFLGRLTVDKGWNFTIKAFYKFADKINLENIAVIVAGDGPMKEEILNKLAKIIPNLHLLGRVSPENIPALLANCDIHITTSEKETKGLTILEAFASGIPVIAPCKGGVIDSIQDNWNGFLFIAGDEQDFLKKVEILINNSTLREKMGTNAREYVIKYNWDNAVQNLLNIWQEQITNNNLINLPKR